MAVSACAIAACGAGSDHSRGGHTSARRDVGGTYVADYIETQGGAPSLNRDAERATLRTKTNKETARGEVAEHDLHFLISHVRPGEPAAFEISTAGFARLDCGMAALHSSTGRAAGYRLLVYKNPGRVKLLFETAFRSNRPPHAVHVPLDGAVDVWLVWKALDDRTEPDSEFVMIAPRLLGGS
jgi:hypothetical protein